MAALVLERQEAAKALEEKELLFDQEGLDRWAAARCHQGKAGCTYARTLGLSWVTV